MSKRLAVVVAHPDDDTDACAATVARHAEDPRSRDERGGGRDLRSDARDEGDARRGGDIDTTPRTGVSKSVRGERGVIAWPQWRPGGPVITDVFEGLD